MRDKLLGVLQRAEKSPVLLLVIPLSIIYLILYFLVFKWIFRRIGFKASERGEDDAETELYVEDEEKLVNDTLLKSSGTSGVVQKGKGVQIVYGPRVTVIKPNQENHIENMTVRPDSGEVSAERIQKTITIESPISGIASELSTVPDETFAGKMMGDGVAVLPKASVVTAPSDGEVSFLYETKHAMEFMTDSGVSLLIHIGIDTDKLDGKGFEALVTTGQKVKKGDPMLHMDLDYLTANTPSLISPVLCTNLGEKQKLRILSEGGIKAGEALFAIDFYE